MGIEVIVEGGGWDEPALARQAEAAFAATLARLGLDPAVFDCALLACDDARIAALNAAFRGREAPTNVLSCRDRTAYSVRGGHRMRVKDDLVKVFRESGLTRLPVYDGTLDTPVGMIHLKDFALTHGFNGKGERFALRKMLRPLLFAPPSMPIGVLLQKMQSQRTHMALVIDEYGGVDGLVTIEDLIEQVIGEIEDEHDTDEDRFWTKEKPGCYLGAGQDAARGVRGRDRHALTMSTRRTRRSTRWAGWSSCCGPGAGARRDRAASGRTEFEVVDADPRRIKRLRVRVPAADA
jgi:magnesium and cobalt transporter